MNAATNLLNKFYFCTLRSLLLKFPCSPAIKSRLYWDFFLGDVIRWSEFRHKLFIIIKLFAFEIQRGCRQKRKCERENFTTVVRISSSRNLRVNKFPEIKCITVLLSLNVLSQTFVKITVIFLRNIWFAKIFYFTELLLVIWPLKRFAFNLV